MPKVRSNDEQREVSDDGQSKVSGYEQTGGKISKSRKPCKVVALRSIASTCCTNCIRDKIDTGCTWSKVDSAGSCDQCGDSTPDCYLHYGEGISLLEARARSQIRTTETDGYNPHQALDDILANTTASKAPLETNSLGTDWRKIIPRVPDYHFSDVGESATAESYKGTQDTSRKPTSEEIDRANFPALH